jgi:group I intron endonuclease
MIDTLATFQIENGRLIRKERTLLNFTGVYQIRCLSNGFIYVGSTAQAGGFAKRFLKHLSCLRLNQHHSWSLQRDWNKLGGNAFVFEIIEVCGIEECFVKEQAYIDLIGHGIKDHSYNVSPLANTLDSIKSLGLKNADVDYLAIDPDRNVYEFRNISAFSASHNLNPSNMVAVAKGKKAHTKGWVCLYATPVNVALARSGGSLFDKASHRAKIREKLRQAHLGKKPSSRAIENSVKATKGVPRTPEVKAKIAKGNARRRFLVIDPTGESKEISNLSQFCRENGLAPQRMVRVAQGELRQHRGFKCQYLL